MNGKTHTAVGVATALTATTLIPAMMTSDPKDLVFGIATAAFSAVLPDIDVPTSKSHKQYTAVVYLALTGLFLLLIGSYFNNFAAGKILYSIFGGYNLGQIVGIIALFILVIFSSKRPHREFTHSIVALVLFSGAFFLVAKKYVLWFAISYLSHILIDLLNKKKVHLLWPVDFGNISFGVCYADGIVSTVMMLSSYLVIILVLASKLVF